MKLFTPAWLVHMIKVPVNTGRSKTLVPGTPGLRQGGRPLKSGTSAAEIRGLPISPATPQRKLLTYDQIIRSIWLTLFYDINHNYLYSFEPSRGFQVRIASHHGSCDPRKRYISPRCQTQPHSFNAGRTGEAFTGMQPSRTGRPRAWNLLIIDG